MRWNELMKTRKPLKSNFTWQGSQLVLPIVGHTLREIRLRSHALPVLIFQDEQNTESQIEFESANVQIMRANLQYELTWNEDKPYAATSLLPFVELLNGTITEALADKKGTLRLQFSNGLTLTATPDVYEGWHFRGFGLNIHGDDGRLIK